MMAATQAVNGLDLRLPAATAGDIAAINLESARQRAWNRFWRAPERPQVAELIVEQEQLTGQFTGDLAAFDRLEVLVQELIRADADTRRTTLIAAQVASSLHRFAEAREAVALAVVAGSPTEATERLSLAIDQATGSDLPAVLAARRQRAAQPGGWAERIPLGALLADLCMFDEAARTYVDALHTYADVSPFAPAWAAFQLGVLWGECMPAPDPEQATRWYRIAIDYLPGYVKARVHLAEIYLDAQRATEASAILAPVRECADPEVCWRLADAAKVAGDDERASFHLDAARAGFERLLARHPLGFADHAAEFYLGSGSDGTRALELARLNLVNRPTARALELYAKANDHHGALSCPIAGHS